MTEAQQKALQWLVDRGGDGIFNDGGVLSVAGEIAPYLPGAWNALCDLGKVEFYNPTGEGRGRCRVIA